MRRFKIRPCEVEDFRGVFAAADESREHIGKWMGWMTPTYSLEDAKDWVESAVIARESGESYAFLIVDANDNSIAGVCGLNCLNRKDRFCNLGYWVRASRLGQGAAREATLALRTFGFGELKLNRIEIVVAEGNTHSIRVAESAGAKYEGLLGKRLTNGAAVYNAHMYAFVNEDSSGGAK